MLARGNFKITQAFTNAGHKVFLLSLLLLLKSFLDKHVIIKQKLTDVPIGTSEQLELPRKGQLSNPGRSDKLTCKEQRTVVISTFSSLQYKLKCMHDEFVRFSCCS